MRSAKIVILANILTLLSLTGCIAAPLPVNDGPALPQSSAADSTENTTILRLPSINSFPSTHYIQSDYIFPSIESVAYVHDGITEALDCDDPRLIRLLNALTYSYDSMQTVWLQGVITGEEIRARMQSGHPYLDVTFNLTEGSSPETDFSQAPRAIISANCYLLFIGPDNENGSFVGDSSRANVHLPYQEMLLEDNGTTDEDFEWGNNRWIDLLAYAGFL